MRKIQYDPDHLESFEKEWGIHKKCKEWWYATGIVFDDENNMYSYQYTLVNINLGIKTIKLGMIALTDYANNMHHYSQQMENRDAKVLITKDEASIGTMASAKKTQNGMDIMLNQKYFSANLHAAYGKGATWHCDNGKLQMGIPGKKETTYYYSYTNMPTEGTIFIDGREVHVKGKTWFDKQGGSYSITNLKTNWEWFSLRFLDDEEMMLFTFPHNEKPYYDGTYIKKNGTSRRFNDYQLKQTKFTTFNELKWTSEWELKTKEKDGFYTIEPVQEGHMNFVYFEELCYIKNKEGRVVGYAFAELLPGIHNSNDKEHKAMMDIKVLFKPIEY